MLFLSFTTNIKLLGKSELLENDNCFKTALNKHAFSKNGKAQGCLILSLLLGNPAGVLQDACMCNAGLEHSRLNLVFEIHCMSFSGCSILKSLVLFSEVSVSI